MIGNRRLWSVALLQKVGGGKKRRRDDRWADGAPVDCRSDVSSRPMNKSKRRPTKKKLLAEELSELSEFPPKRRTKFALHVPPVRHLAAVSVKQNEAFVYDLKI